MTESSRRQLLRLSLIQITNIEALFLDGFLDRVVALDEDLVKNPFIPYSLLFNGREGCRIDTALSIRLSLCQAYFGLNLILGLFPTL